MPEPTYRDDTTTSSGHPTGHDERYAITGANPHAPMLRFVEALADYDAAERPRTVGVMRKVALGVLLVCALLVGFGLLLMQR